ncbi:MAG: alanine--tRNA ligase [Legionellales bacterium]|nr:alanine--tRNA ligase [Legionellales bacterium]
MDTGTIRQKFIDYFTAQSHLEQPSGPLVPQSDPTLLFTNAGMVPFKSCFQGLEEPRASMMVSSQRCMRAGGKHNDLTQVGYTARHHTFFEMLGNFSFGAYFKLEAIQHAWTFLTEVLELPADKLWITVFETDDESARIWHEHIGVALDRIIRCGAEDNFWSMGEVGPCGPCTEIFYDHGTEVAGGPPGSPDAEGDRFVEIWNLVFMQYNLQADGTRLDLPKPCVDTGMGLERIAAVMQGVHDNYDIDIFKGLIQSIHSALEVSEKLSDIGSRVIADHIRAMVFLIAEGVTPSHEGRGYVLRRIIRRAIRYAYQAGCRHTFLDQLVEPCLKLMQADVLYPEAWSNRMMIQEVLRLESQRFESTIHQGMFVLTTALAAVKDQVFPGDIAFQLHDTHGFPLDLTQDILLEHGVSVDVEEFDRCMAMQRERAQSAQRFKSVTLALQDIKETAFTGYESLVAQVSVLKLFKEGVAVKALMPREQGVVVLNQTPFYPEGGGQVGDQGHLSSDSGVFVVTDTQKQAGVILHFGYVESGRVEVSQTFDAVVDPDRWDAMANHTATHLLHAALRLHLGDQVVQKGSLVDADRLRFDFAYPKALTTEQCQMIEQQVNDWIAEDLVGTVETLSIEEAQAAGALALFNEKYSDKVRVVSYGTCSKELCGGTHLKSTAQVGVFLITQSVGIASGIRRIEAVTRTQAYQYANRMHALLDESSSILGVTQDEFIPKIKGLQSKCVMLEKTVDELKANLHAHQVTQWFGDAIVIKGVSIIVESIELDDVKLLRRLADEVKALSSHYIMVLMAPAQSRTSIVCAVSQSLHTVLTAKTLLAWITSEYSGSGGGRPDFAQGVIDSFSKEMCSSIQHWIEFKLKSLDEQHAKH